MPQVPDQISCFPKMIFVSDYSVHVKRYAELRRDDMATCSDCDGTGKCKYCDGTGEVENDPPGYSHGCTVCRPRGREGECIACGGTGIE
jgi:hypothetical protein